MSILLDALKKSEEQRQLGKAPNIHGGPDSAPGLAAGPAHWIPVSLVALSVGLMSWMGWQQMRAPPELAQHAQAGEAAAPATQRAPAAPSVAVPGRTPVESMPGGDKRTQGVAESPPGSSTDSTDSGRQLSESVRSFQAEPANAQADTTADDLEPGEGRELASTSPAGDVAPVGTPSTARPSASSAPQGDSPAKPAALEPISYWQLPQNVRDDMPELKISVLVFAEKPEDRFLLVNGQRLVEKDEIPGGVVLAEIRRDGAVFEYRKYRFLVKG